MAKVTYTKKLYQKEFNIDLNRTFVFYSVSERDRFEEIGIDTLLCQ